MATSGDAEVKASSQTAGKRRYRSALERQRIVEETLQPGASVAVIARAHEVNANQVFCWRKLYRQGRLDAKQNPVELVPVRIADNMPADSQKRGKNGTSGAILIELGNARVRIEGTPDSASIRAALAALDSLRR